MIWLCISLEHLTAKGMYVVGVLLLDLLCNGKLEIIVKKVQAAVLVICCCMLLRSIEF